MNDANDFALMIAAVSDFHDRFNQGYSGPPREMSAAMASLRKKLILEEATEQVLAIDRGELGELLDSLADVLYVTLGTAIQSGLAPVLATAFWRVHETNMQKVLAPSRKNSKRDSAFDIVKPEGWVKPDFSDLVGG